MKTAILGFLGLCSLPAIRQALKSYRARKSVGDIVADTVEAAIDQVDPKK